MWSVERIEAYIEGKIEENVSLEYKRSPALHLSESGRKDELAKDVTAMANAEGGTLIYGIAEGQHLPDHIDDGVDPRTISREAIENFLSSSIHPRIDGLRITPVSLPSGNQLFVLEVPKTTEGGPHQSSDKKYYKRRNFRVDAMEDQEIRDAMGRSHGPDLYCRLVPGMPNDDPSGPHYGNFRTEVIIGNYSQTAALYALIELFIDFRLEINHFSDFMRQRSDVSVQAGPYQTDMTHIAYSWVTPSQPPIWRGVEYSVGLGGLSLTPKSRLDDHFPIVVSLKAPNMTPKTKVLLLTPRRDADQSGVSLLENQAFEVNPIKRFTL